MKKSKGKAKKVQGRGSRKWLIWSVAIIILVLALILRSYIFLLVLISLNVLTSTLLRSLRRNQIGIEMVMFSTVMSGVLYGATIGAIMGAVSMIIDYTFATRISPFALITIPSYAAVGFISPLLSFMSITTLGITVTVAYVVISNLIIVGLMGGQLHKSLRFGISDIAFNALIFATVAPFVLKILT
ncbi:hypothetical protein JXB11_00920 [Candidatus Woesearchaeota archaeon]|nr:hypothetical protein [Candidatus Woesearchaeota archaeon]